MTPLPRILHLGLGRFHRAHQAVYYQRFNELVGHPEWTALSFSMRSTEARDHMRSINCQFPVIETGANGNVVRNITSITRVGAIEDDRALYVRAMQSSDVELVTLTVTEKGYDLGLDGKLNLSADAILHDLANSTEPRSAIGILAHGLRMRANSNTADPRLTVISCDNVSANGAKLEAAVHAYLQAAGDTKTLEFIKSSVKFPSTMVDRIVPALNPKTIQSFQSKFHLSNPELLATETFSKWIIEDKFARTRPAWEKVGVEFVSNVQPFEEMKLRILNASHSLLAYAGLLKNYTYVHEAIRDVELRAAVEHLMFKEAGPLLDRNGAQKIEWQGFAKAILARFENPELPHALSQIAADGSAKIAQRILPLLSAAKSLEPRDSGFESAFLALAAWIRFVEKKLNKGEAPEDPKAQELAQHKTTVSPGHFVESLTSDRNFFGELAGKWLCERVSVTLTKSSWL